MKRITESSSNYNELDKMSSEEILSSINSEDKGVPKAVELVIPMIRKFVDAAVLKMKSGGRLFYIGAGTSGRLGVVDASECPPTFGVDHGVVVGLIAGGDEALRKGIENAEDDNKQAWKDLQKFNINTNDSLVGIAASGTTPYVLGGIENANSIGILTAGISCNPDSPLSQLVQIPITPVVGPEFVTGSTRMKSGTAQKLVLNMISTAIMIKLGKVKGNRMVDMQLSNHKLVKRGVKMITDELAIDEGLAQELLEQNGSVRAAILAFEAQKK